MTTPSTAPGRRAGSVVAAARGRSTRPRIATTLRPTLVVGALLAAAVSCRSAEEYRAAADADVYALVSARRAALVDDPNAFTIDPPEDSLRQRILAGVATGEPLVVGPLTLADCLEIAFENSRDAAAEREDLYRTALDLTLERWRFGWQPSAQASGDLSGSLEEAEQWSADADLGLARLFGSGAQVVAGIGLSFFENLLTDDGIVTSSQFNLTAAQPLLRGFGSDIVMEPLTQAERDLVYEVRGFERFRRTFAFDVASRYLRLLQQADSLANEVANAKSVQLVSERNQAFARAGLLNDIQVDQARQNELSASNGVIDAQQALDSAIDDFKFFLGLPIEADVEFDLDQLEALETEELTDVQLAESEAIAVALLGRYDLINARGRVEDARRAVNIAEDQLRAGLGLVANVGGTSRDDAPLDYSKDDIGWSLGLDLDLPVNQIPERNSYRNALISLQASERAAEEFADSITVGVRDALRNLASRAQSYDIQQQSVALAERRVQSASRNLEAGRAETRDLLEAQESLLSARNARTRALIDFRLAELALWRDLELLEVEGGDLVVDREDLAAALAAIEIMTTAEVGDVGAEPVPMPIDDDARGAVLPDAVDPTSD